MLERLEELQKPEDNEWDAAEMLDEVRPYLPSILATLRAALEYAELETKWQKAVQTDDFDAWEPIQQPCIEVRDAFLATIDTTGGDKP